MSTKRKRIVLSVSDKLKIIDQLKNGASGSSLAREYGVGNNTISGIKKNVDAITKFASALDSEDGSLHRKTMKMAENQNLDTAVYTWFMQVRSQGQPISGPLICEKALEMNKKVGGNADFKATTGWLMRFKSRHGIRKLAIQDEKLSADTEHDTAHLKESIKNMVDKEGHKKTYVYNADKTGLYWKKIPTKSLVSKNEMSAHGFKTIESNIKLKDNKCKKQGQPTAAITINSIEHVHLEPSPAFTCSTMPILEDEIKLEDENSQGEEHNIYSIQHINLTPNVTFSTTSPISVKLEDGNLNEQSPEDKYPTTPTTQHSIKFSTTPPLSIKQEDSTCEDQALDIYSATGTTYNSKKRINLETNSSNINFSTTHSSLSSNTRVDPLSLEHQAATFSMSICRVCMQKEGQPMIAIDCLISDNQLRMTTVQDMLNAISCVRARVDDCLPPGVCQECLQRILDAYQLNKQYESSNATMLEMLGKVRDDNQLDAIKEDENYSSSLSKDSERIFCQECNVTVLKPDLYTHMLKCKMNTNAINTSSNKKILICRGCNYLVHPDEMNEHRKTCTKDVQYVYTPASPKDPEHVDQVDETQHTDIDNIISNISQDHFVPEVVKSSTLSKIKEQFNADFKKRKEIPKSNNSSCEIIVQEETVSDIKSLPNLPIPESLITLKRDIDIKFMKNRKLLAEGAVLVQCTVCNAQMYDREKELHKTICKPPQPTLWKMKEGGMYACNLCDKTVCNTLVSIRAHINQHNGHRADILCSFCGRSVRKSMWKSHQNKHLGIKPYTCDICDYKFTLANDLTNHMRRHTQEKPYQCKLCPKRFGQSKYLAVHKRIHTGEKPYSCVICGKRFIVSGNMHVHMKTHDVTGMDASAVRSDSENVKIKKSRKDN